MTAVRSAVVSEGRLHFANYARNCVELYGFESDAFFSSYAMPSDAGTVRPHMVFTTGLAVLVLGVDGVGGGALYYVPRAVLPQIVTDPYVESSEFAVEPGVEKRFVEVQVLTRYTVPLLYYSVDGSPSWLAAPAPEVTQAANGSTFISRFQLPSTAVGRTFQWKVGLEAHAPWENVFNVANSLPPVYYWRELVHVAVGFIPLPSTYYSWELGLAMVDRLLQLDGSEQPMDPVADTAQLWSWYEAGQLLAFKDRNGDLRMVQIQSMHELEPLTADLPRECILAIRLVEVPN